MCSEIYANSPMFPSLVAKALRSSEHVVTRHESNQTSGGNAYDAWDFNVKE